MKILDKWGRLVAEVKYTEAKKGYSYASIDGKNFAWTSSVTLGAQNNFVLGESLVLNIEAENTKPKSTTSTKNVKDISVSEYKKLAQDNQELKNQLLALQESVNSLSRKLDSPDQQFQEPLASASNKSKNNSLYVIFAALLGLSGLIGFYVKSMPKA